MASQRGRALFVTRVPRNVRDVVVPDDFVVAMGVPATPLNVRES
jgi:hypothetical protein